MIIARAEYNVALSAPTLDLANYYVEMGELANCLPIASRVYLLFSILIHREAGPGRG